MLYHPRSANRPPLRFASLERVNCSVRTAQRTTRHNTTHIDNPTIGGPRFSETCFTLTFGIVYGNVTFESKMASYLRKNLRVIMMCNLEGVSVIGTNGGAGFGGSQLAQWHERASRDPQTERLIRVCCGSYIRKRTKKMPEPTNTADRGDQSGCHGRMRLYCRPPSQPNCIIIAASAFRSKPCSRAAGSGASHQVEQRVR